MSATPVVSLRGLSTRFGPIWVHKGLDLDVAAGEVVSLVGGSGSGKTTLLRQIVGLLQPAEGEVQLFGEPLFAGNRHEQKLRRRRFAMCFQQGALFSALTVFDNIAFPLRESRVASEAEIRDLVALKLHMVELQPHHAALMPAELSGGMIKRVALARALALEPELLLLDEPTAGLDPTRSASFVDLVKDLQRQLGLTVVLVTHDLDTLAALSSRVAVLAEKRILAYDTLDAVMQLEHPFIQEFFLSERSARALERGRGT
ncbi:MAG: ATP-binding cassette domain-containing protein [Rhodocyclaceae bacterium]|nr:ATP-binding cassette domain-containing protein [Rhodocyclaceae bacterium]